MAKNIHRLYGFFVDIKDSNSFNDFTQMHA